MRHNDQDVQKSKQIIKKRPNEKPNLTKITINFVCGCCRRCLTWRHQSSLNMPNKINCWSDYYFIRTTDLRTSSFKKKRVFNLIFWVKEINPVCMFMWVIQFGLLLVTRTFHMLHLWTIIIKLVLKLFGVVVAHSVIIIQWTQINFTEQFVATVDAVVEHKTNSQWNCTVSIYLFTCGSSSKFVQCYYDFQLSYPPKTIMNI